MPDRFATYAFIAGELAPDFYNRTDLDKYALGVSLARNFLIDYKGGLISSPGTAFFEEVDTAGRIYAFPISGGSDVMLFFGDEELLILDPGGTETEVTPYAIEDVKDLSFHYKDGVLTINHILYPTYSLTYDGSWTFAAETIPGILAAPTNIAAVVFEPTDIVNPATGDASTIFVITAVDADGNEGPPSVPKIISSIFNYATEEGSCTVTWNAVTGAVAYRIYRSVIVNNGDLNRAQEVGYIGQSRARSFVDANVSPDYTIQPPLFFNPFAEGAVLRLSVTSGGTGYSDSSTLSIGTGTGFVGYPLVVDGVVVGAVITNGGSGYTLASSVSVSGGSGAVLAVAEVSPDSGLYPSCSTVMQERRVYAGQEAAPLVLLGSRRNDYDNFDYSPITAAGDAYVLPLDVDSAYPITHMERLQNTLLCFHREGVEAVRGADGGSISPVSFSARNQTNLGAGQMAPQRVGNDIIYASALGTQIIALSYTYYTESFQEQDISVLATHLFGKHLAPVRLVWQREPHKFLWVLRKDGTLAVLTYTKEMEIVAWAQRTTDGIIHDICLRKTPDYDYVYWLVERNGQFFIEEVQERVAEPAEEYWGVDCGLRYEGTRVTGSVKIEDVSGTLHITQSDEDFTGTVGHFIRAGGGLFEILTVEATDEVTVQEWRAATRLKGDGLTTADDYWTISEPTASVSGLDHLEGRSVAVVGDGNYLGLMTVTSGELEFSQEYSLITVGLPYVCEALTLPLSNLQLGSDGREKRLVGAAVRMHETMGLEIGGNKLYEVKPPRPALWGEQPVLISEVVKTQAESTYRIDTRLTFRQSYPLPAAVLGFVAEVEMED